PNEAGVANLNGCPDGDSDGVADKDDDCPTEPGTAATNGCPDGDGDGVADKDDECPDEAGLASLNGCPDGDGDGVADKDDDCPAEAGPAETNGCPDRDGDGIADKDDECPDEAGVAERNGCPVPNDRPENLDERIARYGQLLEGQDFQHIRIDSINGTIEIDRIFFPTDVSSLNRPDRMVLEEIDRFLALDGAADFDIRFEGHADRRASDEYNQGLSERRAGSAMDYTAEQEGADASNLSMIGFGENQPVGNTLRENRVVIPVATEPTRMIELD
ncbi:MAG: OmpA family protein, partial [Lewinella sp.]